MSSPRFLLTAALVTILSVVASVADFSQPAVASGETGCQMRSEGDLLEGIQLPGDSGGIVRLTIECAEFGEFYLSPRLTGSAESAEAVEVEVRLADEVLYRGPLSALEFYWPLGSGVTEIVVSGTLSLDYEGDGEFELDLVANVSGY